MRVFRRGTAIQGLWSVRRYRTHRQTVCVNRSKTVMISLADVVSVAE
jgi:hypothetical protein